jgi:hypothetical protein
MAQKAGAALWHMNNSLAGIGCMIVPEFDPVMIPAAIPGNGYVIVDKTGMGLGIRKTSSISMGLLEISRASPVSASSTKPRAQEDQLSALAGNSAGSAITRQVAII